MISDSRPEEETEPIATFVNDETTLPFFNRNEMNGRIVRIIDISIPVDARTMAKWRFDDMAPGVKVEPTQETDESVLQMNGIASYLYTVRSRSADNVWLTMSI